MIFRLFHVNHLLQAVALQHEDDCPGKSGYEWCGGDPRLCCPNDFPVCCTYQSFCCPLNYTCCGAYCCGGYNNATTIGPTEVSAITAETTPTTTTPTPTPTPNDCKDFWTGGCPTAPYDYGFLGILNATDPDHCESVCNDYGQFNTECNSIVFQPFDLQNPNGKGICEMWRHTVEEYHDNCTWQSGYHYGYDECTRIKQDNYE